MGIDMGNGVCEVCGKPATVMVGNLVEDIRSAADTGMTYHAYHPGGVSYYCAEHRQPPKIETADGKPAKGN